MAVDLKGNKDNTILTLYCLDSVRVTQTTLQIQYIQFLSKRVPHVQWVLEIWKIAANITLNHPAYCQIQTFWFFNRVSAPHVDNEV